MKPLVLFFFLILFLALAGMGTIWFIVNKAKCKLPDTSNCATTASDDGYPQLPYCISSDAQVSCANQTKVCGTKPSCTGTLSCDYKTQKWSCVSGSGTDPVAKYCTITGVTTDKYNIFIDDKDTGSNMVDPNATQYTLSPYPGSENGCVLSGCKSGYHVSNKDTEGGSGWCVPDSGTAGQEGCDRSKYNHITGDSHDYKDDNAVWVNAYLTDHTMYCAFKNCGTSGMAVVNNICTKTASDCTNPVVPPVLRWTKGPDGTCSITGCDNTGIGQYTPNPSVNPQSCKLTTCKPPTGDTTFTWGPDTTGTKCVTTGCQKTSYGSTFTLVDGVCQPDCNTDYAAINYFLTGSATTIDPKTNKPIQYFKAQLSDDKTRCNQRPDGSIWGGCGSIDNPSFAVDPGNPFMCKGTVLSQSARYDDGFGNGTEDSQLNSSAGCLLCNPRYCPPGNTDITKCSGDTLCGYVDINNQGVAESAITKCVTERTTQSRIFNTYQSTGLMDRKRDTAGQSVTWKFKLTIVYKGYGYDYLQLYINGKLFNCNGCTTSNYYLSNDKTTITIDSTIISCVLQETDGNSGTTKKYTINIPTIIQSLIKKTGEIPQDPTITINVSGGYRTIDIIVLSDDDGNNYDSTNTVSYSKV